MWKLFISTYCDLSGYFGCFSLQTSIDKWCELERNLDMLESWIPAAFDRISSAAEISSSKSAEQLSAQMKLLLVGCHFVYLRFPCHWLKHF